MCAMERLHPLAAAVYFAGVLAIAVVSMNPGLLLLSLLGGLSLFMLMDGKKGIRTLGSSLLLFSGAALLNPLFYHHGNTVLLIVHHQPITLEALCYGAAMGGMIVSAAYWLRCLSRVLTSDKLMHLLGRLSPKLALLFSMALRYGPLFSRQTRQIKQAQQALGLYKDENLPDRIRGDMRIFSILVTWALENGIITADSMAARGYGVGRRTAFARYRFRKADAGFLLITAALLAILIGALATGALDFAYYPALRSAQIGPLQAAAYGAYAVLAFLPVLWEGGERIRWHCLKSRI